MITVGIAGCGSITRFRHAPEYLENGEVRIAGFYDYYPERAREMTEHFGGKVYETFDRMLADEHIDAVSICTANKFHSVMTIQALQAKKHVLCEKPMAMSVAEAAEMVHAAKENDKILMVGHNQRLVPAHKKAKELLEEGAIGDVLTFRTTFCHSGPENWGVNKTNSTWFFKKQEAGFGSMADLGVHKVDLMRWLLDTDVAEVSSVLTALDKRDDTGNLIEVDDNSVSILCMENGVLGTVITSWSNYGEEDNSTVIYGTEGVMKIFADPRYAVILDRKSGEKVYYDIGSIQSNDNQSNSGVIDLFVENLKNQTKPEISGEDAMRVMEIVFAMEKSSKEKRRVFCGGDSA